MPKSRSSKLPGTYEWINATIELPPVGVRPSRAGNNDTGAKGKLKCAGCRLSKIKCIYDHRNPEATCSNCVRRGIVCGEKLPGPKAQIETIASGGTQDRDAKKLKEYVRLFGRFQQLRPDDGPDEIAKLVSLVESGILKEQGGNFVVRCKAEEPDLDFLAWEPSSQTTARMSQSEFVDGYFGAPAMDLDLFTPPSEKLSPCASRLLVPPCNKAPLLWLQESFNQPPNFCEFGTVGFDAPFSEMIGQGKYF